MSAGYEVNMRKAATSLRLLYGCMSHFLHLSYNIISLHPITTLLILTVCCHGMQHMQGAPCFACLATWALVLEVALRLCDSPEALLTASVVPASFEC